MNTEFIKLLQKRIANTSIGPSTARKMGPKGTIQKAREYLIKLKLSEFQVKTEKKFLKKLNDHTDNLKKSLPKKAQHWGSSRKFINIFLRGCLYNRYICKQYKIQKIERWLEIPLDSHVIKGLKKEQSNEKTEKLPAWKAVIKLGN